MMRVEDGKLHSQLDWPHGYNWVNLHEYSIYLQHYDGSTCCWISDMFGALLAMNRHV